MANRGGQASWRGGDALTLRQFRYFVAVAETGSVSRAAFEVGISQSAITAAIQALEEETGTVLFERHAKGMRLTHEGHQLLRHARHILATVADARSAARRAAAEHHRRLNIGVTRMVSGYYLADLLARFRRVFQNSRSGSSRTSAAISNISWSAANSMSA